MGQVIVKPRQMSLEPQSYGKWRGSSVRKRRWGGGGAARISARNRIKASAAERVATQHPPYCECGPPEHTAVDNGGQGVFRACRLKAARAGDSADGVKQRRDPAAIDFRNAHPASPQHSRRQQRSWILRSASRRIPRSEPFAGDAARRRHPASAKPGSSGPLRAYAA
jgi:hypothetical protein